MADQTVTSSEVGWALLCRLHDGDMDEQPVVYEFADGQGQFKDKVDPYAD